MLLSTTGKPLIQHTYEAASRAKLPTSACVATDDEEIVRVVRGFGAVAHLTPSDLASGTDRVAYVARQLPNVDIIVNVQGDEPELSPEAIDDVIRLLDQSPTALMSTVATPLRSRRLLEDPACVKVVCDERGRAIYFSRSVVPHPRQWSDDLLLQDPPLYFQHVGIYAYRRDFLLQLAKMPASRMERVECLEQLRVLEAGISIEVGIVENASRGIDTQDDYTAFVERTKAA